MFMMLYIANLILASWCPCSQRKWYIVRRNSSGDMVGDRLTTGGITVEGFILEKLDLRNVCFFLRFLLISSNAQLAVDFRGGMGMTRGILWNLVA